ncbi:transmembrane 132A isoform X2 [Pelobates cultripes]|uniref:Transmembrane 132A isoform X2 n=1 Tax=Pelobates cultripes TaxID=61616 RepID=A0AAD1WTH1_PELCU|nr:transmembrane 132A isoform X2 [Pelobates cultripes]CAH2321567.1 transmembrane 132A isoform X2 [Pelobates cultripes]CAH2321568.1 transmembrane 132A isoform X2 [Pelobates cultripes]CAH2321570.1 transmembrane 132A isoform X2 [Pelobates cultripes]
MELLILLGILSITGAISGSPSIPSLPLSLEVKDVPQYFRLQRAVPIEETEKTISKCVMAQSHSETFLVTRLGSREPHVRASYQHLQDQVSVPWKVLGARVKGVQGELVGNEVSPSDPVARVLFHRSGADGPVRGSQNQCVTVQGTHSGLNVEGSCKIQIPLDVCVVELLFSPSWFTLTSLPLNVTLNYSVSEDCEWTGEGSEVKGSLRVLSVGTPKLQKLSVGDSVTVTLPDKTLLPGEVFTASISLRHNWTQPSFSLRVRCRAGLELLFARSAAPNIWAVKTEMQRGAKHHTVIGHVTHRGAAERRPPPVVALLDFLVGNVSAGSAVSRRITFQLDVPGSSAAAVGVRGSAEVLVSDRDLRAIIPLVKSHEILNTAPLTGISQKIPVRVLALEAGGSVLDVTKQAGCETPNAQIVQVSDGCDFLFVGGKETQGALGVKVEFWLERLRSSLSLSLWVPLLPLRVEVSDTNLQRLQGFGTLGAHQEEEGSDRRAADRRTFSCRTQYQRARVRFLAYFVAHSLDGSRQLNYLLGTDWLLDVSPLIRSQAVIRDSRIARLEEEGSVLIGQEPGVTSVEVRSPLSHSILGEQTILVSSETVSILELGSHLVWGISLSVNPYEIKHPGVFTVSCQSQNAAVVPKQESALSLWLVFSDMSISPITIYDPLELSLSVVSPEPSVLSVRRNLITGSTWSLPTLVYEGPGEAPWLRWSLLIPERCRDGEAPGLLSAGRMCVTFPSNATGHGAHSTSDIIQRDSDLHTRDNDFSSANNVIPGTSDIILRSDDTLLEDDESHPGADDIVTTPTRWGVPGLEEGLYGLLAIFSLLTLLFLVSCVAFIMRHRNKSPPDCPGNPEAPNWVWLEGPESDVPRTQGGGGGVREEEEESGQWEGMDRGPQSLTSTFHPVRNTQGSDASIGLQPDTRSFSTPTSHSRALLEAKRPEAVTFQTPQEGERKVVRMPDDPSVRSILVASEEDIMWVCKDMGMREPQEILSYMERIRGETPPLGERRREGPRGRGMDIVGASVRRLT